MLTIKEAADYADKSESWVRQKILSGEISAKKNKFKYGKRWETTKKDIDDFLEQAKIEKDIVEVREIENPISKEEFIEELTKTIENQNEQLLEDTKDLINYREKMVSDALKEQNKRFLNVVRDEVGKVVKSQNELILDLKKHIKSQDELLIEMKKQLEENKDKPGLLSRIKNFLFS